MLNKKRLEIPNKNKAFNGSNGWLRGVLNRNNLGSLKLHGEGGEFSPEHAEEKMREFRVKLADELKKNDVSIDRIEQTGLFYGKLPNTIYCDKIIDAIEADEDLAVDVDQNDEVNDEEEGCTSSLNCNNSTTSTHSYLDAEAALSLLREYVIQEGDTEDAMKHVNILAGRIRSKRLAKIVNKTQTTVYDYFA